MRTYGLTFYLYSLLLSTKCPEKIVSLQTKTHESSSAYEKTHPCSPNLLAALFIVSKLLRTDSFIRSRHVSISFAFPDELVLHCAPPAYTSPCVARCACALASSAYGALPCLPYLADTGQCGSKLNATPCTCKNCGDTFTGNFCPRCGQSRNTPRYVLKGIVGNVLRTVFRVDGKFAHTLLELLYRPGHMMRDFIRGRRVNYTLPLPMVFLMTAFYMLTAQLIVPEIRERKGEKVEEASEVPLTKAEGLRRAIRGLEEIKTDSDNPIGQKNLEISIREIEKRTCQGRASGLHCRHSSARR